MWYKLYIRRWDNHILVKYVQVENKWDLFAVIGWLHSTTIEKIDRLDYEKSQEPTDKTKILYPPRIFYK